ncbi:hypothetical protein AB0I84_35135 [Streptomyces spectabilis]|uniref:hypothetical protein n=1 Tax=Streptomyces spectabilis TaxID=68270 RepID=UPI0033D2220A
MTHPIVEVAFGYTLTSASPVWTDISAYTELAGSGISIVRGAQDELSETQPGTCQLTLDNSDGRFTPHRTAGAYYPNVKKNVPLRVSVATVDTVSGAAPWPLAQLGDAFDDDRVDSALWGGSFGGATETGGRARIPCAAGVFAGYLTPRSWTLTGSKVTVKVAALPTAGAASTCVAGIYVASETAGTYLAFEHNRVTGQLLCLSTVGYTDGAATVLTYNPALHGWLRIRESAGTTYWETSHDGYAWTVRRSLATPAWVGTDDVTFSMEATRNAGADDVFEVEMVGATVHPRFYGMVNDWPVQWQGLQAKTAISCTDLFKWAGLGRELLPMLNQEVLLDRPTAYYPLSEPADSTSAGDLSGTPGVSSLTIVQAGAGGTLTFDAGTGPSDGLGCPTFAPASSSAGKYLSADLGQTFTDANVNFRTRIECWFSTSTDGRVLLALTSSDNSVKLIISLESGTGKVKFEYAQDGAALQSYVAATPNLADGNLHYLVFHEFADEVSVDGTLYTTTTTSAADFRLLYVGGFANTRLWNGQIAQLAIYVRSITTAEITPHYTTGTTEHVGESADVRAARIASYVGLTVTAQGTIFDAMASQKALGRSALDHLREIETTESGKLLASRAGAALLFQSRSLRYNPVAALSLAYGDLETGDVQYADDDQKMVNEVRATRHGGATQRIINQDAIDTYGPKPKDVELFKNSDLKVTDAANWLVSRYADPPPEIRQVPVEAFSLPVATYRTLLDADVSTVLTLTGLPDQAPASTATVVIEGYTETIGLGAHRIDFHTSRAQTDAVWVLDDPVYSVLGSTTRLAY